jgi:hypothetical protein
MVEKLLLQLELRKEFKMKKKKFSIFNANFDEKSRRKQDKIINKVFVLGLILVVLGLLLLFLGFNLLLTKLNYVLIITLLVISLIILVAGIILTSFCKFFNQYF